MKFTGFHSVCFLLLLLLLSGASCRVSLSGGGPAPDTRTFLVQQFQNNAPVVVPTLAQDLTLAMQDRMQQQTRLAQRQGTADVIFSGTITEYRIEPINVQAGSTAAQNRLTVTVQVHFENTLHPEQSWDQPITTFLDFDRNLALSDIQTTVLPTINKQLTQNIYNKAFSNW